jgi:hypothetical protein
MKVAVLVGLLLAGGIGCVDDDGGGGGGAIDAAPTFDADPACQGLDSIGGFPDCSVCDALGSGCDTIDVNGNVSQVCDCSAACPCGLRCGDYEIAPDIVVGNICIR